MVSTPAEEFSCYCPAFSVHLTYRIPEQTFKIAWFLFDFIDLETEGQVGLVVPQCGDQQHLSPPWKL